MILANQLRLLARVSRGEAIRFIDLQSKHQEKVFELVTPCRYSFGIGSEMSKICATCQTQLVGSYKIDQWAYCIHTLRG